MTGRDQLLLLCKYNRALAADNQRLRRERDELSAANANLRVERDSADELLGVAMDRALTAKRA
jgi:hypothetical protein